MNKRVFDPGGSAARQRDAEDIVYQIQFDTEIRMPFDDLPIPYASSNDAPGLPPGIFALDGLTDNGIRHREQALFSAPLARP